MCWLYLTVQEALGELEGTGESCLGPRFADHSRRLPFAFGYSIDGHGISADRFCDLLAFNKTMGTVKMKLGLDDVVQKRLGGSRAPLSQLGLCLPPGIG